MFEIAAEISGGGKTQLVGGFFDCLLGMRVYDALRLRHHIPLNPFQWRETVAELTEHFRKIPWVITHQPGIEIDIAILPVVLYHQVAELRV